MSTASTQETAGHRLKGPQRRGTADRAARTAATRTLLAVDIGGSFTDAVMITCDTTYTAKVLTTRKPEEGVIRGIQTVLGQAGMQPGQISLFILGTTLATNALIERKGSKTALLTTEGFRDIVQIGQENRYAQYDIFLEKPEPLVPRHLRFGIKERIDVHGRVLKELDTAAVAALARDLQQKQVESVAVCYLHSYVNPAHEIRTAEILAREAPGLSVTLSSDVCPEVREYERTSTACANAYVQPVVARSLRQLQILLAGSGMRCPVYLMTSGGALATLEMGASQPVKLIESGPAGGAILARQIAEQCGEPRALSYDMGGTTAKICFIDDFRPEMSRSFEFGRMYRFMKGSGLPVRIPVIEMVEIGAGGGSIAAVDDLGRVQVGPDSATSDPGPACFGRSGTRPTVTDANCVLGLLDPERFAGGEVTLQPRLARDAIRRDIARPLKMTDDMGALAVSEIVAENMAAAARVHGIEQGKDIESYSMIAFGGAAPLHAAQLASKLGLARIIIPTAASVGSALGFLWAPVAYQALRSRHQLADAIEAEQIAAMLASMRAEARQVVRRAAPKGSRIEVEYLAYMRYVGQGHEIPVALPGATPALLRTRLRPLFEAQYLRLYGRTIPERPMEIMTWSVTASTAASAAGITARNTAPRKATPCATRTVFDAAQARSRQIPVYQRGELQAGSRIDGPALVAEDQTTTVVPPGYTARVNSLHYLVLDRNSGKRLA
jgi:N-methylhydantoinase A